MYAITYGRMPTSSTSASQNDAGGWVEPDRDPCRLATQALAYHEGLAAHANLYGIDPETFARDVRDGLARLFRPTVAH
jgi:hypothetical protein